MAVSLLSFCLAVLPIAATVVEIPIYNDHGYSRAPIELGTPPETYQVQLDTGSPDLWVFADTCRNSGNCTENSNYTRTGYSSKKSSTSKTYNAWNEVTYIDSGIAGFSYTDNITLPVAPGTNRHSRKKTTTSFRTSFISALGDEGYHDLYADGIFGLGFTDKTDPQQTNLTTPFETMMQSGDASRPRFGYYMGTALPLRNGSLTLGGSNEQKYTKSKKLTWIDVIKPYKAWQAKMTSYTPGDGKEVALKGGKAIFDSGTVFVLAPPFLVEPLTAALGFNSTAFKTGFRPLCSSFLSTNNFTLHFDHGKSLTVTAKDLAIPGFTEDKYCWPPIQEGFNETWVLGKNFLQSFYTVYDFGSDKPEKYDARVGLARLSKEYLP